MNPNLRRLEPYPFERLAALKAGLETISDAPHLALSIGEPKHPPPAFVVAALADPQCLNDGLGGYPATRGGDVLRNAVCDWLARRFRIERGDLDADRHVLPVNGTREALFSFGQCVLSGRAQSRVVLPNPFYQIYEGAALLKGATPAFVRCLPGPGFRPDFAAIGADVWRATELVYVCSPGNPTGAVLSLDDLERLIALADRYDFVIAADECYAEIYAPDAEPPPGLLAACARLGRTDFRRCVVFHSLSKRSSLPGLRSGFVAGDAAILERYYLYRTYHGCAMPAHVQAASARAWQDEAHVVRNRLAYAAKFDAVLEVLGDVLEVERPAAGFYLWPLTPIDDETFTKSLFVEQNVTVLPGRYLARAQDGINPGRSRVRIALVAELDACIDAAQRIRAFVEKKT